MLEIAHWVSRNGGEEQGHTLVTMALVGGHFIANIFIARPFRREPVATPYVGGSENTRYDQRLKRVRLAHNLKTIYPIYLKCLPMQMMQKMLTNADRC